MDEDFLRECESAIQDRDLKIEELLTSNRSKSKEIEDLQTKIENNPNDDNLSKEMEDLLLFDQSNLFNIVSFYKIMRPNLKRIKENLISTKEKINEKIKNLSENSKKNNRENIFKILSGSLSQIDSILIKKGSTSKNNDLYSKMQELETKNQELNIKLSTISKALAKISSFKSGFSSFKSSILLSLSKYRQEINQAQSLLIKPLLISQEPLIISQKLLKLGSSKLFKNSQTINSPSHHWQTEKSEELVEKVEKDKNFLNKTEEIRDVDHNLIHYFSNPKNLEENIENLYQSLTLPPNDSKEPIKTVKKIGNNFFLEKNDEFLLPIQKSLESLKIRLEKFETESSHNLKRILEKIKIEPKSTKSKKIEEKQKAINEKVKKLMLLKSEEFKRKLSIYEGRKSLLDQEKGRDELAADLLYRRCLMRTNGKTLGRIFV